jgi:hypothetical protein
MAKITHHCQNIDAGTLALCLQQNGDHFQHLL